ncbi:hypothetical protein OGATHE_004387 [Ogataea polymorpha]|uniref:Uncharacterized protein n=1 Tax=Ogataea polymorpha TaxID=460523 RepID=A0A9P8T2J9_9ASCO|nr:hypothetical protein OGATHE_004387 [Ogataea polymorpha]
MNVVLWWHTSANEITLMLWKIPGSTNQPAPDTWPRTSAGMAGPRNTTISRITDMLTSAMPLALASRPMSLVSDSGNEMPVMHNTISVFLASRKSTTLNDSTWRAKTDLRTCGIVSPMITANPTLPPNPNRPWASRIAVFPRSPYAWLTKPVYVFAPDSLVLTMIMRSVQSLTTASRASKTSPVNSPALRNARGMPTMPAPRIELDMLKKAARRSLLPCSVTRWCNKVSWWSVASSSSSCSPGSCAMTR